MTAYSLYSDQELTSLLKDGERLAFDELYWKYHHAVYRNIFKFTKDEHIAMDILQDVFTALWDKRHQLDADQSVSGWLFVVSFNQSVNHTKKKLKEANYLQSLSALEMEADVEPNISDVQYELLEQALKRISPQRRRVFELCKLEGKTYEEAAAEMNISKHTVKEYLSGAMLSIKEFIKANPGYSETAILALFIQYL